MENWRFSCKFQYSYYELRLQWAKGNSNSWRKRRIFRAVLLEAPGLDIADPADENCVNQNAQNNCCSQWQEENRPIESLGGFWLVEGVRGCVSGSGQLQCRRSANNDAWPIVAENTKKHRWAWSKILRGYIMPNIFIFLLNTWLFWTWHFWL